MSGSRRLAPLAVLLATGVAIGPALVGSPDGGRAVVKPAVGTCHDVATVQEFEAVSDDRPPVPCRRRHLTETVRVGALPARVAAQPTRPSDASLRLLAPKLPCGVKEVSGYVGSSADNLHWFLDVKVRFPSRAQWAAGVRSYRCDVVSSTLDADGRPSRRGSLEDLMDRPASAAIRPCLRESVLVPCSEPHDSEIVSEGRGLEAEGAARRRFRSSCQQQARSHLGADPATRDLAAGVTDVVSGHGFCVLQIPAGSEPVTGTVSAQVGPGS